MEIDSKHLVNNIEILLDGPEAKLLSSCSVGMDDIFGDPKVLPRVGHQYQADIPHLIFEYDCLQLISEPSNSEILVNIPNCVSLGLQIPIKWANIDVENVNGTLEFEDGKESQITSNDEHAEPKVESFDTVLHNRQDLVVYSDFQLATKSNHMDVDVVLMQESKAKLDQPERGLCLLPGSIGESWTQVECESFILALYIFGKNLNFVKRFVESKGMGDILSFYYGKFYRSDGYRRWSECWKLRSRRFVHRQKIFTGWRQQELLSRLSSLLSEECKNKLLEEYRKFGEGKISFEEYIFTLKNAVGINNLIEAVGVGKGKKDLTGTAMEPIKTNHVFSVQPEIPFGKACSSLTSADIIRFLTGAFRLSKARSSDLFWEAVWPRLLARGWHSEQPKGHSFANSKNSLVFLIPGVKKFSRRKLVKGDHYFDSVSDVLYKVASEPGILELEVDAADGNEHKEEDRLDQPVKQESEGLSNKQHHCYLRPRKSSYNRHLMQFTIVDTSLLYGAGQSKLRELRSLPIETTSISTPSNLSSESEEGTSEDSEDDEEETNIPNADDTIDKGACADSSHCENSILNGSLPNTASTNVSVENHANHSTSPFDDKQPKSCIKLQCCLKANSSNPKCFAPVIEQQDLVAVNHGESSCSIGNIFGDQKLEGNESHWRSNSQNGCWDLVFQLASPQNLSTASSLAIGSSDRSPEGNASENCLQREVSSEKPKRHTLIDLNVSQVSSDFGNNEPSKDIILNNDSSCENISSDVFEPTQPVEEPKPADAKSIIDQQPINRRQSTRIRPLTTKALEAFAFGYLSPKRKRKDEEAPRYKAMSKPSRIVHGKSVVSSTLNNGVGDIADSKIDQSLDALCGHTNIVDEYQV